MHFQWLNMHREKLYTTDLGQEEWVAVDKRRFKGVMGGGG